ncbi:hypothetical protein [Streptomyces platensis]|uniref:hypothetical protein n=1 Tax=Streptomyces platensis TaxID=58346 RepID=UPI00379DF5F8
MALLRQHAWSGPSALLDLDAGTSSSSALARAALAQRAALRVHRLRPALEAGAAFWPSSGGAAGGALAAEATGPDSKALDRADVTTD